MRLAKVKALIMQKGERVEISAYDEDGEDNVGVGWAIAGKIAGKLIRRDMDDEVGAFGYTDTWW